MKSRVVIVPCDTYDAERVKDAVKEGMRLLGGYEKFIKPGEKILLKPNLLRDADPEKAIITHPSVIQAVGDTLIEAGFSDISCGDSCGVGSSLKIMKDRGIFHEGEDASPHIKLVDFSQSEKVTVENGGKKMNFAIAKDVLDADAIISISKMKTHALEHITGAVKNQYGCISGLNKAKGHTQYPDADSFARMLIHLNMRLKPRLYIMDAIVAMEGNGPASGDPVPMNMLLFSSDATALDTVFAGLINLDKNLVPTIAHGAKMGFGCADENEIEVLTESGSLTIQGAAARFGNPDFNVVRTSGKGRGLLGKIGFLRVFKKKPYIIAEKCKKCGICVESCPVEGKALTFENGRKNPPVYQYKKCIRCFCCQEMCPYRAIEVK